MYYILKFNLQKGEGSFPISSDVLAAIPDADYKDIIKTSMTFSFNNDNELLPLVEWKLVDDGISAMSFDDNSFTSGPKPIVWLKLEDEVDIEDKDTWVDALSSGYKLAINGVNDDEPFYFQDHNGYSAIESAEWLADDLWETMQEIVSEMDNGQTFEHDLGLVFKREQTQEEDYSISLTFNYNGVDMTYKWLFETESAIEDFYYYNNEYLDTNNCSCAEENPLVLSVHSLLCNED